jgi:hypothetical protein
MATSKRSPARRATKTKAAPKRFPQQSATPTRTRTARPYPASSFKDALVLADAIMTHAAGERVRRLTLLEKMQKSATSGPTKMMITNSGKYGITTGSYAADYIELTQLGKQVVDPLVPVTDRQRASFLLAIEGIPPFSVLYEHYKGKRLPQREVIKDVLKDSGIEVPDLDECVDTFTVNVKDLNLLRTIGGAETLLPVEAVLEELSESKGATADPGDRTRQTSAGSSAAPKSIAESNGQVDWEKTCFYITPIGADGSEERKHADLFMNSLVEPALAELGLKVVRADKIGDPGMITTQILEYLKRSRLAIADLSYLNPNVFYEVALRHALRLPVVQMIRKSDRLPFDVNQLRTLVFDTSDIYSLVPKLQTYQAEIATQARKAMDDPDSVGNPVSIFYPDYFSS